MRKVAFWVQYAATFVLMAIGVLAAGVLCGVVFLLRSLEDWVYDDNK